MKSKKSLTAGELREFGFVIPRQIPDRATVERPDLLIREKDFEFSGEQVEVSVKLGFAHSFKWKVGEKE
jgi:hypothetical protein